MVAWHDGMMIEYGVASTVLKALYAYVTLDSRVTVLRALYAYVTMDSRVTVLTSFYSRETDTQRN